MWSSMVLRVPAGSRQPEVNRDEQLALLEEAARRSWLRSGSVCLSLCYRHRILGCISSFLKGD